MDAAMEAGGETPSYLTLGDEQLYTVHHRSASPPGECRGAVLLVGPMALERTHAYAQWVRWARHLAREGYDALRFDFRGVGESTGEFEVMRFDTWERDVERALDLLARKRPGVPIVVHGLRAGALLAARLFARNRDVAGMLLWEPPKSARELLQEVLRRKLAADYAENTGEKRKTREQYIAELEAGKVVEVEGYPWSKGLWTSAGSLGLELPAASDPRPWRVLHLDGRPAERFLAPSHSAAVRVPRPPFWMETKVLRPDLSELFAASTAFVRDATRAPTAARANAGGAR